MEVLWRNFVVEYSTVVRSNDKGVVILGFVSLPESNIVYRSVVHKLF